MNVTEANCYVPALNRIAERVTMLASAIEEAAWESFEDHPGMSGGLARSPQPSSPSLHRHLPRRLCR